MQPNTTSYGTRDLMYLYVKCFALLPFVLLDIIVVVYFAVVYRRLSLPLLPVCVRQHYSEYYRNMNLTFDSISINSKLPWICSGSGQ